MSASKFMREIFGDDVLKYSKLLSAEKKILIRKYPDKFLAKEFATLDKKFISIAPMALMDATLSDLSIKADKNLLLGVGLSTFHISPHDDLIDETPERKEEQASLLYSGNITLMEGVDKLLKYGYGNLIPILFKFIKTNHLLQQKVTELLWKKEPPNLKDYEKGIRHIISFTSIGPVVGLHYAKKENYVAGISKFCENYGLSIQYMDDMIEIDEDLTNSYWSLPIIRAEELGIKKSMMSAKLKNKLIEELKEHAYTRLRIAREALCENFPTLRKKTYLIESFIRDFKY